jgi:molecular chaperone DnaJ
MMDFYVLLGLQHGATDAEIKRAYRRLARRFHPDINPGDRTAEQRFRQILAAYETLIDPQRRHRYDLGFAPEPEDERRTSGFEGFDFSARGSDHSGTFGDLVAEVLSERDSRRPSAPEPGADLHQDLQLEFEEAFRGAQRTVTVTRREVCRTCAGAGRTRTEGVACLACQGSGAVRSVRGHMIFSKTCPSCGGTGQQRPRLCEACSGTGHETRSEGVRVRVPAGVADNERVRVPGKGNAGFRGGRPGDLYITVHVSPHALYTRAGDDLHMVVPIALHEAALGARVEIPTPDGPARLRIPPGTQSGQRFRLRERGAPSTRDGRRGDLVVEVRLMLPRLLDERSKELLREFGRINGDSVRDHLSHAAEPRRPDSPAPPEGDAAIHHAQAPAARPAAETPDHASEIPGHRDG